MICPTCADAAARRAPASEHCTDPTCTCGHRDDRYRPAPTWGPIFAPVNLVAKALELLMPEPTGDLDITPYLVVHRYRTDRGDWAWSWNCDGDGSCEGHRALDFDSRDHAERNAHIHLAARHATWREQPPTDV